jgi:hypothetical protein
MPEPKEVTPDIQSSKPVEYESAGKESLTDAMKKSFPKELIPTKRTGFILGFCFLIAVVIGVVQFPLDELKTGNFNTSIEIGVPATFLDFSMNKTSESPLKIKGLLIDLLIYLLIGYIIDVAINLVLNSGIFKSKKKGETQPKVFEIKKKSISEKVTEKVYADKKDTLKK